jgi:uncharacterized protein (TIGR00269 family)
MNKLPYCNEKCPYSREAPTVELKKWIHELEERRNGIMLNFAKSFEKIEERMEKKQEIRQCSICGYPSYGKICKFCRLREKHAKI